MTALLLLAMATLLAAVLRGVTGFGFALAAVPIYSLGLPPIEAVILAQMLQILAAPGDVIANRGHIDRKALGLLCAGALVLTPVGAVLALRLDPDALRLAIAVVVLLGLAVLLTSVKVPDGTLPALAAGGIAGLLAGLAAMPGPPAVAYFLGRHADRRSARASLLLFFAFTAAVALTVLTLRTDILRWQMVGTAALLYPVMLGGTWIGARLFERMGDGQYRSAALGVMALSALLAGARGLSGLL